MDRPSPSLRVLVIEDDPWIREGIARILEQGGHQALGLAGSAREGLAAVTRQTFDLALVDLRLPDGGGPRLIADLRAACPALRILVLTALTDAETVLGVIRAGAHGYVQKTADLSDLQRALSDLMQGGTPLSASVAGHLVKAVAIDPNVSLSARERDVLSLLARGFSYPEIGRLLGLTHGTVQSYMKALYKKLDVNTKAEAAVVAARLGLL